MSRREQHVHAGRRTPAAPVLAALLFLLGAPLLVPSFAASPPAATAAPAPAHVIRRALQSNPTQEYFLYVPSRGGRDAPLFVTVHGISRNAEQHATAFAPASEKYGVVMLAPLFTDTQNDDYQRLGRVGRGSRSDLVLDTMIEEVAALTGVGIQKIYLFGFSGGAQFVHRYTMAHPERVAAAAVGAAGWYTFPDTTVPYPYGIGPSPEFPAVRFRPADFLRVPITVFVGEADTGNGSLRRNPTVDRQQGKTRLERAGNWVTAMRAAAQAQGLEARVTCERVPGIHHSFEQFVEDGQLTERVFGALFGMAPQLVPAGADGGAR